MWDACARRQCDACDNWFHYECVRLTKAQVEQIENYFCPKCQSRNPSLTITLKSSAAAADHLHLQLQLEHTGAPPSRPTTLLFSSLHFTSLSLHSNSYHLT